MVIFKKKKTPIFVCFFAPLIKVLKIKPKGFFFASPPQFFLKIPFFRISSPFPPPPKPGSPPGKKKFKAFLSNFAFKKFT